MIYAHFPMRWNEVMAEDMYLRSELFASHGITGIFTTRLGGISKPPFDSLNLGAGLGDNEEHVRTNLDRVVVKAGLPAIPHRSHQCHGIGHIWCEGPAMRDNATADVLLTQQAGCAVSVRTADCTPILLVDPKTGIAAAVHAGWRGTAKRIVRQAVTVMQSHGSRPEHILASLGPCIGPCCFSIGEETTAALMASCDDAGYYIHANTADLAGINALQLQQAGVSKAHIESIRACTACDNKHFFSYRRDGDKSGRHLAIVAMPEAP